MVEKADNNLKREIITIIDFVEGKLSIEDFEKEFRSNEKIKHILVDKTIDMIDTDKKNMYDFILSQDINKLGGALNIHGMMCRFLDNINIKYKPIKKYSDLFNLMLDSQPRWLDIDGDYFMKNIYPKDHNMKKMELKKYLKEKMLKLFKYHKKPPSWIQSPEWPIVDDEPLIFIRQIKLENYSYFNEDAVLYIFHNPKNNQFKTIIQFY